MKYVYIVLFILTCGSSFGQKSLQVIHKKTGEVLVIQEKEKVKIKMYGILFYTFKIQD